MFQQDLESLAQLESNGEIIFLSVAASLRKCVEDDNPAPSKIVSEANLSRATSGDTSLQREIIAKGVELTTIYIVVDKTPARSKVSRFRINLRRESDIGRRIFDWYSAPILLLKNIFYKQRNSY